MSTELDYMEYATDALAQAAYVTNGLGAEMMGGWTNFAAPYAYTTFSVSGINITSAIWDTAASSDAAAYNDLSGAGLTAGKTYRLVYNLTLNSGAAPYFRIHELSNGAPPAKAPIINPLSAGANTVYFVAAADSAFVIIDQVDLSGNWSCTFSIKEVYLSAYSESTIKEQGSYSLKGIAVITDSLNKTLIRTIGSPIDLSGLDRITFKIRASRTGANIKIGFTDAQATVEVTPTIAVADTWQTVNSSLWASTNAQKDAINSIIITIVNADAANTFYIDDVSAADVSVVSTAYSVELRNKSFQFKQYLTPFVSKIQWEWNRLGGCGRCQIEITKGYRDIIFSARDDIQIRVKDGSTTKLVYRGYLANITPTLKVGQKITLDVRGYFDILKKIVVHSSGDTLSYAAKTVAFMADNIADTFIVPNTPITIAGALTAGAFTADAMDFLGTVAEALKTLAELQGDIEYGVDENLVLFWETESATINNKFFVGNNVAVLERKVNWDSLVNKIYLIGGEVTGTKYKKTAENTDSQAEYYLAEEIINNSSITTDGVSAQYMGSILTERAQPRFSFKAQIKNTALRIEDTVPLGQVTFYDPTYDNVSLGDLIGDLIGETADGGSNIIIGETGDGGSDVKVGRSFSDQIDRISYKLSDTPGRFNIEVQLGDTTLETAAKLKQLELKLNSLQATG